MSHHGKDFESSSNGTTVSYFHSMGTVCIMVPGEDGKEIGVTMSAKKFMSLSRCADDIREHIARQDSGSLKAA